MEIYYILFLPLSLFFSILQSFQSILRPWRGIYYQQFNIGIPIKEKQREEVESNE